MSSLRRSCVGAATLIAIVLGSGPGAASAQARPSAVALFPVENLSAAEIPAAEVMQLLVATFKAEGVRVLEPEVLEAFLARHRVRYTGGIDGATADLLKKETGVDGVAIASVELASLAAPPRFALFARLVSITAAPVVVWAEDVGMAGDDAPGWLALGMVDDPVKLLARSFDRLGGSLASYLRTGKINPNFKTASKFQPKSSYRNFTLEPGKVYSVAVVPFFNLSARRNAGEILALHFLRHLSALPQFRVIDAGAVRQQLLNARIIMDSGLSIADADTVAALIDAELVLAGRVLRYEDSEDPGGTPGVEFSTALIEKSSRRIVWSSDSYASGTDNVGAFSRGTMRTAHVMATQMARRTAELIAGRRD